ncbi:MAG: nucleotide exchange factor GrpE [Dermatophilaceae bacterium]
MSENDTSTEPGGAAPAPPAPTAPAQDEPQDRVLELEDRLRRAMADLDNVRKRHTRDIERSVAEERARVAAAWLPVVDALEMALEHAKADPATIIGGVQAVRDQALALLDRLGFPRQGEEGSTFDPAHHEAVSTIRTDQVAPGSVMHVVRAGYGKDGQLLRPAAVIVATEADDGHQS